MTATPLDNLDTLRERAGFLTVGETIALFERGVLALDPFSILIGRDVEFAGACRIEPGVVLEARNGGHLRIGVDAAFGMGTKVQAYGGRISVGGGAEIGLDRGFVVRADGRGTEIAIGEQSRILGGGALFGASQIGRGAQILGAIEANGISLADGESYRGADPDSRGGVLKGAGVARGLSVGRGEVVSAFGDFALAPKRRQAEFHRRPS